jgi:hypothetical protein
MKKYRVNSIVKKILKEVEQPTVGCVEGVCKNGKGKFIKKTTDKMGTHINTFIGNFGSNEGMLEGEGIKTSSSKYNMRLGDVEETSEGTFSNGQLVDGTRETKTSKNITLEVGTFTNGKIQGQGTVSTIESGFETILNGEFDKGQFRKGTAKYDYNGFVIKVESNLVRGNYDYEFMTPTITTPKGKKYTGYLLEIYGKSMTLLTDDGKLIKKFEDYAMQKENESADVVQNESRSKKIIKLNESDLTRIVKRIINFNNKK